MSFFDIFRISQIKNEKARLEEEVAQLQKRISDLGCDNYEQVKEKIQELERESALKEESANKVMNGLNNAIANNNTIISDQGEKIAKTD